MYKFFTDNTYSFRIARHVLFWFLFFMLDFSFVFVFEYRRYLYYSDDAEVFRSMQFRVVNFLVDVAFSYVVVYLVIPWVKKTRKTWLFVAYLMLLLGLAFILKGLIRIADLGSWKAPTTENVANLWLVFIAFLNGGPPLKCLFFLCGKLLKGYYLKNESMKELIRQNSNAELQLLMAQVHPHFLFNTLNNIYSYILSGKENAADLVNKLKNTMTYMLTDCQASNVPLQKELELIDDYIELEKVRYGGRINVQTSINGIPNNKTIHPLLLVPIVENCFKHGTSQMIRQSWINIDIDISENELRVKIVNSKSPVASNPPRSLGIGMSNVKRRMELLYKELGKFEWRSTADFFTVDMSIPIDSARVS